MADMPFLDSFRHYDIVYALSKWTFHSGVMVAASGRRGGQCLRHGAGSRSFKTFGAEYNSLTVGVAMKAVVGASGAITFWNVIPNLTTSIEFLADGRARMLCSNGSVRGAPFYEFRNDRWYYIELLSSVSSGTVQNTVRVNEEIVLNPETLLFGIPYTGDAAAHAKWAAFQLSSATGGTFFDDLYVTTSGFYGDVVVEPIMPNGVGLYSQWVPTGAATGWEATKEKPPDGDASYVQSTIVGEKHLYNMENIPTNVEVKAAQFLNLARKTKEGTAAYYPLIYNGASELQLRAHYPSVDSYLYSRDGRELNPFTGNPWTPAEINAIQFGGERFF